jgi:hypothetical protein
MPKRSRAPKTRIADGLPAGCVPHLPAPADWPEKPVGELDGCVPPKGLLEELSKLVQPGRASRKRP